MNLINVRTEDKTKDEYLKALELHREDIEKITENRNIDEKLKRAYIIQGDALLKCGDIDGAIKAYQKAKEI